MHKWIIYSLFFSRISLRWDVTTSTNLFIYWDADHTKQVSVNGKDPYFLRCCFLSCRFWLAFLSCCILVAAFWALMIWKTRSSSCTSCRSEENLPSSTSTSLSSSLRSEINGIRCTYEKDWRCVYMYHVTFYYYSTIRRYNILLDKLATPPQWQKKSNNKKSFSSSKFWAGWLNIFLNQLNLNRNTGKHITERVLTS